MKTTFVTTWDINVDIITKFSDVTVVTMVTIIIAVTMIACRTKATYVFLIVIITRKRQKYFSATIFSVQFKFEFINTILFLVMCDTINITAVLNNSCVCCASYIKYKDFNLCYCGLFFGRKCLYTSL
jgi:hypothetical protein